MRSGFLSGLGVIVAIFYVGTAFSASYVYCTEYLGLGDLTSFAVSALGGATPLGIYIGAAGAEMAWDVPLVAGYLFFGLPYVLMLLRAAFLPYQIYREYMNQQIEVPLHSATFDDLPPPRRRDAKSRFPSVHLPRWIHISWPMMAGLSVVAIVVVALIGFRAVTLLPFVWAVQMAVASPIAAHSIFLGVLMIMTAFGAPFVGVVLVLAGIVLPFWSGTAAAVAGILAGSLAARTFWQIKGGAIEILEAHPHMENDLGILLAKPFPALVRAVATSFYPLWSFVRSRGRHFNLANAVSPLVSAWAFIGAIAVGSMPAVFLFHGLGALFVNVIVDLGPRGAYWLPEILLSLCIIGLFIPYAVTLGLRLLHGHHRRNSST